MAVDEVSYYEYVGAIVDGERRDKLRRALGPANKASHEFFITSFSWVTKFYTAAHNVDLFLPSRLPPQSITQTICSEQPSFVF